MANTSATAIIKDIEGLIDPARMVPSILTDEDKERHDWYLIYGHFYSPPPGGLYTDKTDDGTYLYNSPRLKWIIDTEVLNPHLPEFCTAFFNPIPELVDIDTAAMMNEFSVEGIQVLNEKSTITSTSVATTASNKVDSRLTEIVHDIYRENDFDFLYQECFGSSGSKGDCYQRVYQDPFNETENGIIIENYSPNIVYPVLSEKYLRREIAFRIMWRSYAPDKIDSDAERLSILPTREYREVITPIGSLLTIDGKPEGPPTIWSWTEDQWFMPFIHYGHNIYDHYWGIPTGARIIDSINKINHLLSLYWYAGKSTGHCQTYYTGERQIDEWKVGYNNHLYYLGKAGSMASLTFPLDGSHIQILEKLIETVKNNLPHFKVEDRISGLSAKRPETIAAMYGNFLTYATMLQNSMKLPLRKTVNAILRVANLADKPRRVDIDMGSPVSEAIMSKLDTLSKEAEILASAPNDIFAEKAMTQLNYDQQQKTQMKEQLQLERQKKEEQEQREIEDKELQNAPNKMIQNALTYRKKRNGEQQ